MHGGVCAGIAAGENARKKRPLKLASQEIFVNQIDAQAQQLWDRRACIYSAHWGSLQLVFGVDKSLLAEQVGLAWHPLLPNPLLRNKLAAIIYCSGSLELIPWGETSVMPPHSSNTFIPCFYKKCCHHTHNNLAQCPSLVCEFRVGLY